MSLTRKDIELMAPAGSFESLEAAFKGGADAVYFGLGKLNMRARSSFNFTFGDLDRILERTRENQCRAYLTLNTVVYDHELGMVRDLIDMAADKGVDAIIASDLSVIDYAVKRKVDVHISTQLNITNLDAVKFFSRFSDTMVLARELDLEKVRKIAEGIRLEEIKGPSGKPVRLEMFIHGALCMAISGKCYLSLHEQNHSANRGDCFQVCRRGYTVKDKESDIELDIENQYIMSPKDLMTIHFLNKILDSGVRVLKIEGRARSPEYVKTVTSCYHEAIQSWLDGDFSESRIEAWKVRLASVFNRGFWDGYYLGQRLGEWSHVYGSQSTHKKNYIGKGKNYFDRLGVAEFLIESGELCLGDKIVITGPTTGIIEQEISDLRVERQKVEKAVKGDSCSFPVSEPVRRSDKLYKWVKR